MRILGIESSCDETAAAVVEDGRFILSSVIASSVKEHQAFGGVVPEIASRQHLISMIPVLDEAVGDAGGLDAVDAIAVTAGPGLVGSLLVGLMTAKTLAWLTGKPLVGVHHLEAHLQSAFVGWPDRPPPDPEYPQLALLVSGGHTLLFHVTAPRQRTLLGATRDDAVGEAYDKAAKILGLGYPGGRIIDELACTGDLKRYPLPIGLRHSPDLDTSFSGLKTALAQLVARLGEQTVDRDLAHVCAGFQHAVVTALIEKMEKALGQVPVRQLVIAGGVAANSRLRAACTELAARRGLSCVLPPRSLCTDNAAMVAAAGMPAVEAGEFSGLDLNAFASSTLSRRGGNLSLCPQ
jgi:N6-L-threonylcarbamoyladenine synthase